MISALTLTNMNYATVVTVGLIVSILLIIFLGSSEIAEAGNHRSLPRFLLIGIIPLFCTFVVIVIMKIMEILG